MEDTDISLLHKHVFREVGGRQSGRTYYQCSLVVGAVELGNDVVVMVPCMKRVNYIKQMIKEQLRSHNIRILKEKFDKIGLENGCRVVFTTKSFHESITGYDTRETAFVDIE